MTVQFPSSPLDCRRIEALLPPFVDGEADGREAGVVEAHLTRCAACRQLVAEQREVRTLLTSRRASLREPAPVGLEARLRSQVVPGAAPTGSWWRRLSPLAAAAAVVLAVAGGLYWGTGQSSVLLAAQLTLDHIKCFMIDGDEHARAMTAGEAQAQLHQSYGMDVAVPSPHEDQGARLVGVRSCLYGEGWVAHVLYRVQSEPVSMFVLAGHAASAVDVAAFGRHARVITRHGTTYVLVAPAQLADVAAAVGLEGE